MERDGVGEVRGVVEEVVWDGVRTRARCYWYAKTRAHGSERGAEREKRDAGIRNNK